LFDIRAGVIAPTVGPEIVPVIAIEPDDRAEADFLRENRLFQFSPGIGAGGAGVYGLCAIQNVTTDRLAIIEHIQVVQACSIMTIANGPYALAGAINHVRDTRYAGQRPGCDICADTIAAFLGSGFQLNLATGGTYIMPIVLSPGYACQVRALTANTLLQVSFAWRERTYERGELT